MTFSMMISLKIRANIRLFRQLIKRLVTPCKRPRLGIRSAIFLIFLIRSSAMAGFEDMTAGARHAALADAGVALAVGAENIFANPAGIFSPGSFDAHLFYTKPFGLDIFLGNCAVRYSRHRLAGAFAVQSYGNDIYRENQFLAAAAVQFFPALTIGVACRYGGLSIQNYGHTHSILFDFGMTARLFPKMTWGFCIKNAGNAKIGVAREALPTTLTTGVCLQPLQNLQLLCDLSKDTRFPLDLRCGIDYKVFEPFSVRVGVGNEPSRFCAGFAISFVRFHIDYAFSSHLELGLTHLFSVGVF